MKYVLLAAMALSATAFAASADPMQLSDTQMDQVSAGVVDDNLLNINVPVVVQPNVPVSVNTAAAIGVLAENISALAKQDVDAINAADIANTVMGGN